MKHLFYTALFLLSFYTSVFAVPTTYYVKEGGAGGKTGLDEANAMDLAAFDAAIEDPEGADDTFFVESGDYPLTGSLSVNNQGSNNNPIKIIGVTDLGTLTPAYGDDRPNFTCGGNDFYFKGGVIIQNIRGTSEDNLGFWFDGQAFIYNCDFANVSAVDNRMAIYLNGDNIHVISTHLSSTNGFAAYSTYKAVLFTNVWMKNSKFGFYGETDGYFSFINCDFTNIENYAVATSLTIGVYFDSCFFDNVLDAFTFDDSGFHTLLNCSFTRVSGTAIKSSALDPSVLIDYCLFYDNNADVLNVSKGSNCFNEIDPEFVDPDNGDFTIQNEDLIGAGFPRTRGAAPNYPNVGGAYSEIDNSGSGGGVSVNFGGEGFIRIS